MSESQLSEKTVEGTAQGPEFVGPPAPGSVPAAPTSCALLLPANLGELARLAGDDRARFALSGVHLVRGPEGYRAEATDGQALAVVTGTPDDAALYPDLPGLAQAPNGATEALVPAKEWRRAFRAAPRGRLVRAKPVLGNVAAVLGETVTTLASTDLDCTSLAQPRNVEGRFPDAEKVLAGRKKAGVKVTVDAALLAEFLKVAAAFSPDGGGRVTLELAGDGAPLRVGTGNGRQTFRGLVMPLG
jgi:hypothetical protein